MRSGIRASQAIAAASKAFCKRIAQSKLRSASWRAVRHFDEKSVALYGIISSQNGSRRYKSATQGFARMAIFESGNRSRKARRAGKDMTASPTQFVARTKIELYGTFH